MATSELQPRVRDTLCLYMVTNRKEGSSSATRVGCASDPLERLRIYNSPDSQPGSDRRARQAAGYWRLVLVIIVPESSGLSGSALKRDWKEKTRKIHRRFAYGVQAIARHYGLPFFVDIDEVESDIRIAIELPELIYELRESTASVGDDDVERVASSVTSHAFRARTLTANGLSFARVDRPRERYRKRPPARTTGPSSRAAKRVATDAATVVALDDIATPVSVLQDAPLCVNVPSLLAAVIESPMVAQD